MKHEEIEGKEKICFFFRNMIYDKMVKIDKMAVLW